MYFLVKTVLTSLFIGRVIATVKCCQSYALNVCLLVCFSWEVGARGAMYLNMDAASQIHNCFFFGLSWPGSKFLLCNILHWARFREILLCSEGCIQLLEIFVVGNIISLTNTPCSPP